MVSVRQVTQRNAGRRTAGIDGEVALTPEARAEMAVRVHQSAASWHPRAVRRVYNPVIDLIKDEQSPVPVAGVAQAVEEVGVGRLYGFRLKYHGRDLARVALEEPGHAWQIVVGELNGEALGSRASR